LTNVTDWLNYPHHSSDQSATQTQGTQAMTTTTKISIYQDGIFAGCGDYANETIQNCAAQFCDDNDESMDVYEAIEEAINLGGSKVKIEFADGSKHTYTWDLTSN
jgi:hypothetical protein